MTLALGMILIMGVAARARRDSAPETSYRTLANQIAPYLRPGCVVGSYRHNVQSIPFYTGFREALVSYRGELASFGDSPDAAASFINRDEDLRKLWSSGQCLVLLANRKDLPTLQNLSPLPVIVACEGKKVGMVNEPNARPDVACTTEAY